MVGDVNCAVLQWNPDKGSFDRTETAKDYTKYEIFDATYWGSAGNDSTAKVSGIVGLRATAADLDGDGKDEFVTLLFGYYHRKEWEPWWRGYSFRADFFRVYPHLAVWTFNRGSTKPIHDDAHVMGGGDNEEYNFGVLYDLAVKNNTNKELLGNHPFQQHTYAWYSSRLVGTNQSSGTDPDRISYLYGPREISITAGPLTGQIGTFSTVDDIAVSWKDKSGHDCVTVFKTKLKNGQFDGFEDGKIAQYKSSLGEEESWRGLLAVDIASEGVELGAPTHLRKELERSYVAVLNAIPYHVDTVSLDGTALPQASQPVNFTFSEGRDGKMNIVYGQSTLSSGTNSVKQDLSQTVETMLLIDPAANGKAWAG